ncbi:MAG: pre-peptidase C-terminal domain-containing protein [Myxococcaceae bacterium]|nr:pre-peptidase C-terminal domain-containing protein [Myxococcaceae bacterium]
MNHSKLNRFSTLSTAALMFASACVMPAGEFSGSETSEPSQSSRQKETWSSRDNPSLFSTNLEMKLEALPMNGEAEKIPWAGSYWPTYEDSINHAWDGADSPSLKYEKAFGGSQVEDKVSRMRGIDSAVGQKECSSNTECTSETGEALECAKRRGKDKGRCIPTWWGICHAWTPAAILFPEPKNSVVRNGVTFQVPDLKALASLVHDGATTQFVSLRCDKNNGAPDGGGLRLDEYGRPSNANSECRDTNAGTYHVLLANYLGKMKQSFAEDRTLNYEVWNQPLRGYRVLEKRAVTAAQANQLIGVPTVSNTPTTQRYTGSLAAGAWFHAPALTVRPGQVLTVKLSGQGDGDLYVRYGAQPTSSQHNCRPYVDRDSNEQCQLTVPLGQSSVYISVFGHAAVQSYTIDITLSAPQNDGGYVFNNQARQFYYLRTEVTYIGESDAYVGYIGPRIDSYTHVDNYEYVLELDAAGKIIGGEWVGHSKQEHPDFLWLPTGPGAQTVAEGAISYQTVKSMVMESAGQGTVDAGTHTMGEVVRTENATVAAGEWKQFGPYPTGPGNYSVTLSGTGDADLHTRMGAAPTEVLFDCRPYEDTAHEVCTGQGPGGLYVGVQGYTASTFSLRVAYIGTTGAPDAGRPDGGGDTVDGGSFSHLNVSGSAAANQMKVFTLAVPAGRRVVVRTTGTGDVDLYVRFGSAPTDQTYDAASEGDTSVEQLTYTATQSGTLYIGVFGYVANSTFTLTTADN